jgi:hypothetical protein
VKGCKLWLEVLIAEHNLITCQKLRLRGLRRIFSQYFSLENIHILFLEEKYYKKWCWKWFYI